ncbi:hypothetical protein D3C78_603870 [compost metagenome]
MFTTHVESLETLADSVDANGEMNWFWATRKEHTPWFHLGAYDPDASAGADYTVLMLDSIRALEAVLTRDYYRVVSVQIVMPSYVSGKDGWSMEPLSELIYALDGDGMPVVVYRTKSGGTYQHSAGRPLDTPNSGPGSRAAMGEDGVFEWGPA